MSKLDPRIATYAGDWSALDDDATPPCWSEGFKLLQWAKQKLAGALPDDEADAIEALARETFAWWEPIEMSRFAINRWCDRTLDIFMSKEGWR